MCKKTSMPWLVSASQSFLHHRHNSCFSNPEHLALRWDRLWRHVPNLLDEEFSLINKLLIVGSVLQKVRQKVQELLPVHEEYLLDWNGFVGVGNKDLEHMEAFILNHFPVVSQEIHADLQMLASVNVCRHDIIV